MIHAVSLAVCHTVADMTDALGPILPDDNRVTLASATAAANSGAMIQTIVNRSDSRQNISSASGRYRRQRMGA